MLLMLEFAFIGHLALRFPLSGRFGPTSGLLRNKEVGTVTPRYLHRNTTLRGRQPHWWRNFIKFIMVWFNQSKEKSQ